LNPRFRSIDQNTRGILSLKGYLIFDFVLLRVKVSVPPPLPAGGVPMIFALLLAFIHLTKKSAALPQILFERTSNFPLQILSKKTLSVIKLKLSVPSVLSNPRINEIAMESGAPICRRLHPAC
jgi:hypothetical protein